MANTVRTTQPGEVPALRGTSSASYTGATATPTPTEPPPRVFAVIPGMPEGTQFIFSKRQVQALQQLGVPVETFFLSSRQHPPTVLREMWQLWRELRVSRPDVVHAHFGTMTGFVCAVVARCPVVVTYRGSDLNPVPSISVVRSSLGKLLSQLAAARAARIICVSPQLADRLWWGRRRATVIPNGVDTGVFRPRPRAEARRELGWADDERVVLFNGGRFPKVKRLDLAEAAVEVARARSGPVRLEVLDGNTEGGQVPTLMNAADCLIVTSDWEGSPDIVKEAMACRLPIVSVEVGDVRERLDGVWPSHIVERDPTALGEAIVEVLARGERSNGHVRIQELSMASVALRVLAELREAARRPAGTRGRRR